MQNFGFPDLHEVHFYGDEITIKQRIGQHNLAMNYTVHELKINCQLHRLVSFFSPEIGKC
jgi:hypothetical protein